MNKNPKVFFSVLLLLTLAFTACKKDDLDKVPVVEAGASRMITLPIDTVTLSGSATDADGYVTAYLWSQISGPAESDITNPGSATSLVNYRVAGTYLYQLMAVDDEGATGVDTVSVLVNPSLLDSTTLTANPNDGYFDLVYAGNSTSDYADPSNPDLDAAAWTWNSLPDILRSSLMFNLSKLPQNISIQSAKLTLYSNPHPTNGNLVDANYGTDNSIYIRRVTGDWDMSSGWFTQPSTTNQDQVIVPHTNQPMLDLIDLDVTNMVSAMQGTANHGFMIGLVNETAFTSRIFCGVRYTDASKHPTLKITFKYN